MLIARIKYTLDCGKRERPTCTIKSIPSLLAEYTCQRNLILGGIAIYSKTSIDSIVYKIELCILSALNSI